MLPPKREAEAECAEASSITASVLLLRTSTLRIADSRASRFHNETHTTELNIMSGLKSAINTGSTPQDYQSVKAGLLEYEHIFSSLPTSPHRLHSTQLRNVLASLQIHPVLEAILHLLNLDLPAAHFLCRHMENRPAEESMFVHGILHRIEGDYNNTRAWYGDVEDADCFKVVWGGKEKALRFIDEVEKWTKSGLPQKGEEERLRKSSLQELMRVLTFCEEKFGCGKIESATTVWVPKKKTAEQAAAMITGGEGWREF